MPQRIDPAKCRAVLVGIDGYAQRPLTSAVNDVDHVHAALRALDLVAEAGIVRLVSPAPPGGLPATRRNISAALFALYEDEAASEIDRFFFFFAGHGIAAFSGATRGEARTALLPADVESLDLDGNLLLDFDDLRARMRFRGPKEQLYFLDACRDLPYARQPDVGPIGWAERPRAAERAQAVLYAVPPLGQARAEKGGLGTMTRHLVDALHGRGEALDWDDDLEAHVVTMRSVHAHVARAVRETVSGEPGWKQKYSEPRLEQTEPGPRPLRMIDPASVPDAELAVHVEPEEAASSTKVQVYLRGQPVGVGWPPHRNHEPVSLRPLRYALRASTPDGEAPRISVDARVQHEATVQVVPSEPARRAAVFEAMPAMLSAAPLAWPPGEGGVAASTQEPGATIELTGLEPPYARFAAGREMKQAAAPGSYRITFRLGSESFHDAVIDVAKGETTRVRPPPDAAPEGRALTSLARRFGPMSGGVVPTLLATLGMLPFPAWRSFEEAEALVLPCASPSLGARPLSIVGAAIEESSSDPIAAVLDDLAFRLSPDGPWSNLGPLRRSGPGLDRIRTAVVDPPASPFVISLRYARALVDTALDLPTASLEGHATVVTVLLDPDGSVDVHQHLVPLEGADAVRLRALVVGELLHRRGELLTRGEPLGDVLRGRRVDPLLSAMAFFARARSEGTALDLTILRAIAQGLASRYGALPDSVVIRALASPAERDVLMTALLDAGTIPLLAESARFLAEDAVRLGRGTAPVVEWVRRIPAGSIWAINRG
jgi:Caspase domain